MYKARELANSININQSCCAKFVPWSDGAHRGYNTLTRPATKAKDYFAEMWVEMRDRSPPGWAPIHHKPAIEALPGRGIPSTTQQ